MADSTPTPRSGCVRHHLVRALFSRCATHLTIACAVILAAGCAMQQMPQSTPDMFPFHLKKPFDQVTQLDGRHPAHTVMPSYLVVSSLHRTLLTLQQYRVGSGNALVLTKDGLVVTNAHVARFASSSVVVLTPQGVKMPTQLIGFSPHYDLVVLQVPPYAHMRPLTPSDPDQLNPGDTLYAMGISRHSQTHGEARVVNPKCTTVHPYTKKELSLITVESSTITHGYSGGPLFTKGGEVVGMIVGQFKSGHCDNKIFAIRIDEIISETQRIWHDFYQRYSKL